MIYLCNTFSLHMLPRMNVGEVREVRIRRISAIEAGDVLQNNAYRSFFGHDVSAWHLGRYLHTQIPVSRGTIQMDEDDVLIVAAITSKRRREAGYKSVPGWVFYEVTTKGGNDEECKRTRF